MKKLMVSTIILLPILLLAILLVSGAIMSMVTHIYVESVEFIKNEALILTMSDENAPPTYDVTDEITILPLRAKNRDLKFGTDDESIVTVDENGVVKASYYGETYIYVVSKENKAAIAKRKVIVTDTKVHAISLNRDAIGKTDLYEGEKLELSVSFIPKDAENKSLKWTSDNDDILHVSANGTITARGAGKATITATSNDDPTKSDSITFVCHKQLRDLSFETKAVVSPLKEFKLPTVTCVPADADAQITYASSDESIATVDEEGNVKFKREGQVTITVTGEDFGGHKVVKYKSYTSTDGYYMPPLFSPKEYTVNYEDYKDGETPLPIAFAPNLAGTSREFKQATFEIPGVLRVDATDQSDIKFYFVGEMPAGRTSIRVDVEAYVYKTGEDKKGTTELYSDYFILNVQRNAASATVSYGETQDVGSIVLHENDEQKTSCSLKFDTSPSNAGPNYAIVSALPANHTNEIRYALAEGDETTAAITAQGKLTFKAPGTVTVSVSFLDAENHVTIEKKITVTFASLTKQEEDVTPPKGIEVVESAEGEEAPEQPPIVLNMGDTEEKQEQGILYFAEPAGTTVVYEVVEEPGADPAEKPAVRIEERNGVQYIVPQRGGFATITITVTPGSPEPVRTRRAQSAADGVKVYTFEVYVDRPVEGEDLAVTLGGSLVPGAIFGTTLTSVPYDFTVTEKDGSMQGKKLYLKYTKNGEEVKIYGSDDIAALVSDAGNAIAFGTDLSTLPVTFGVEYTEDALRLHANAKNLETVTRTLTLHRNASEVKVAYGGAEETENIVTNSPTLRFGPDAAVTVLPANHTDTGITYSVSGDGAEFKGSSTLTFTDTAAAHTVTVTISIKRGNEVTFTKEILVTYLPKTDRDIDLGTAEKESFHVLFAKGDMANLYLSVPTGETALAQVTEDGVVELKEISAGAYTLTAKKGGFTTVTVTAGEKTFAVNVFVDVPLSADDFTIKFGEKDPYYNGAGYTFGTAGDDVPYNFTVNEKDGSMQGKKLYVTYETVKQEGEADAASLNGSIDFKDQATLVVTFSVKYSDDALGYGAKAETLKVSRSVTLKRNATGANFIYKGEEVENISTTQTTLTFIAGSVESTNASQVGVAVAPANHTNTLSYSLGERTDMASITSTGVLTFKTTEDMTEATKVTVKLSLLGDDGTAVATETIVVTYQPRVKEQVNIELSADKSVQKVLLNFGDTGNIIYSKPTDATVSYEVTEGVGVVEVTEQESAMPKIVTRQGGFATVTVTVTPTGGGENTVFTIQLYVDRTVKTENYKVQFNGTECDGTFGTTSTTDVPFTVTFDGSGNEGAMEGKKFYISYSLNGEPKHVSAEKAGSSFTGTIPFAKDLSALSVTFGVEYDAEATAGFDPKQDSGTAIRTIERNVSAITVAYGGATDTVALITRATSLTFGDRAANVTYTLAPENHTEKGIQYAVEGNGASFTGNTLTFGGDTLCTVKVLIKTTRGNEVTFTKEITVTHLPATDKDIDFGTAENLTQNIVLAPNGTARFYFTVQNGDEIGEEVTLGDNSVVRVEKVSEEIEGAYTVTALKGGFATVTVTAGEKRYTLNVYVDAAVKDEDLKVDIGDADTLGTTEESVSFTVTVDNSDGKMEGKKLVVTYGKNTAEVAMTTEGTVNKYTGTIPFGKDIGSLKVTFGVEYTAESIETYHVDNDGLKAITVEKTLQRNAETLTLDYSKVVTSKDRYDISNIMQVAPEAHTDVVFYSIKEGEGIASVDGSGVLTFQKEGVVTVTVAMKRGETALTLSKEITVGYAAYEEGGNLKKIDFAEGENNIVLKYGMAQEQAAFYFTLAEGQEVSCGASEDDVVALEEKNGTWYIVPQKGGFATVTLTIGGKACTVKVYVDVPVTEESFTIEFQTNGKFLDHVSVGEYISSVYYEEEYIYHTYYGEISGYTVTMADENGSMAGKKLHVLFDGKELLTGEDGTLTLSGGKVTLSGTDYHKFTFSVEYTNDATAFVGEEDNGTKAVDRYVRSSQGTLLSKPTITYHKGDHNTTSEARFTLNPNGPTDIEFIEVESYYSFGITGVKVNERSGLLDPIDTQDKYMNFVLASNVKLTGSGAVTKYGVSAAYGSITQIDLKAVKYCQNEIMYLEIFGQSFELNVSVVARTQTIEVKGGTGANLITLDKTTKYRTVLDSLTFQVEIGRNDEIDIPNKNIQWCFDGESWDHTVTSNSVNTTVTVTGIASSGSNSLFFRSADGGAEIQILLEHVANPEFGYDLFVIDSIERNTFASIEDVSGGETLNYTVPGDMQGAITFEIKVDAENYLGGYEAQDFSGRIVEPEDPTGWTISVEEEQGQIIFHTESTGDFKITCAVIAYGKTINVTLSHYNLSIVFPGFDSGNKANGGDVYKGYQQVRVFAKHSDYGAGVVDYFKLPIRAIKNASTTAEQIPVADLTWTFTGFKGNAPMSGENVFTLTQTGTQVTFTKGSHTTVYTIVPGANGASSKLQTADGTPIAEGGKYLETTKVPWVDVYAEAGYAHLYFGGFTGLSETDVQNDYFGNFDEKPKYTQKQPTAADDSGRDFTVSTETSYTFLRVGATFGAGYNEDGKGKDSYFNFNILADDALVNVFNATGFNTNSNVVLQTNLYGPGELGADTKEDEKAKANDLYLNNAGTLGKTTIYGNGYQVNFEAKTASMSSYSESDGITVNRAYNTIIKCANPTEEISSTMQKMVLKMEYAYYCDLSYYYKFNPSGNTFYTKNTVFSCVPKTAVQLYYNGLSMYAENIVMTEVGTSVQADNGSEQEINFYYKGTIDILNYFNQPALLNLNSMVGGMFNMVVPSVKDYFEWHGKTVSADANSLIGTDRIYVNVLAFAASDLSGKTYVWTNGEYKPLSDGAGALNENARLVSKNLLFSYYALTYEMMNGEARLDNATAVMSGSKFTGNADMNSLFSDNRYIRLQCEFKDKDVRNYEHIKWHKENVYRDYSIIGDREGHTENLKNSLKGVQWPDGSGVDANGTAYAPAAAFARMLSETTLPGKED